MIKTGGREKHTTIYNNHGLRCTVENKFVFLPHSRCCQNVFPITEIQFLYKTMRPNFFFSFFCCSSPKDHTTCTYAVGYQTYPIPHSRTKSACLTSLATPLSDAYRLRLIKQLNMTLNPHRINHPAKDFDPSALYKRVQINIDTSSLFSCHLNPKD